MSGSRHIIGKSYSNPITKPKPARVKIPGPGVKCGSADVRILNR